MNVTMAGLSPEADGAAPRRTLGEGGDESGEPRQIRLLASKKQFSGRMFENRNIILRKAAVWVDVRDRPSSLGPIVLVLATLLWAFWRMNAGDGRSPLYLFDDDGTRQTGQE